MICKNDNSVSENNLLYMQLKTMIETLYYKPQKDESKPTQEQIDEERNVKKQIYEMVSITGMNGLSAFTDAVCKLFLNENKLKSAVTEYFLETPVRNLYFKNKEESESYYSLLTQINNVLPVDDFSDLSFNPYAAVYGSEIKKGKGKQAGSIYRIPPMNLIDFVNRLQLFIDNEDYDYFTDWVLEILRFDESRLQSSFAEEYRDKQKEIAENIRNYVYTDPKYKEIISEALFSYKKLDDLLNDSKKQTAYERKISELEKTVKLLTEELSSQKNDYEVRLDRQKTLIEEKKSELEKNEKHTKDYDQIREGLDILKEKYDAQVIMNEKLTILFQNETVMQTAKIGRLKEDTDNLKKEVKNLETQLTAVKADLRLKENDVLHLTEKLNDGKQVIRQEVLEQFVSGFYEQYYYLSMYLRTLKETGSLDSMTLELFSSTMQEIQENLEKLGITIYGGIEEKVAFDSSLYSPLDGAVSNGEEVIVSDYGWKVNDKVIHKAAVEKENK